MVRGAYFRSAINLVGLMKHRFRPQCQLQWHWQSQRSCLVLAYGDCEASDDLPARQAEAVAVMFYQHDNTKRWRPQFSLRAMLGVFVIVGVFFCGWKAHEQWLATRPILKPPSIARPRVSIPPTPAWNPDKWEVSTSPRDSSQFTVTPRRP